MLCAFIIVYHCIQRNTATIAHTRESETYHQELCGVQDNDALKEYRRRRKRTCGTMPRAGFIFTIVGPSDVCIMSSSNMSMIGPTYSIISRTAVICSSVYTAVGTPRNSGHSLRRLSSSGPSTPEKLRYRFVYRARCWMLRTVLQMYCSLSRFVKLTTMSYSVDPAVSCCEHD